jgi:regulatory protein
VIEPHPKRRRRGPKPATAAALEHVALHYLERYASSSANLRRVLLRRVARAARAHDSDPAAGERLVDEIIARYLRSGLLDDRAYATSQAASLRRRGASRHGIRGRLAQKGVARDLVEDALGSDAEARSSELAAACALVRRRRLGPCRAEGDRARFRQKDLAALARAGFDLGLARRVLALTDAEAVAALERGEDQEARG